MASEEKQGSNFRKTEETRKDLFFFVFLLFFLVFLWFFVGFLKMRLLKHFLVKRERKESFRSPKESPGASKKSSLGAPRLPKRGKRAPKSFPESSKAFKKRQKGAEELPRAL